MRTEYDIDSRRPGRGIAVTLDLTTFSVSESDILSGMSLSPQQLAFAHLSSLPAYLEGSATTLYYPFGAIRVRDHILRSVTPLLSGNVPWIGLSLREEDSLTTLSPIVHDLRPLSPIKPLGRAVTLTAQHRPLPTEALREIIQVHILPEANRKLLQYRYSANNAYGLVMRLAKLESFAKGNAMIIGNVPLRAFF